MLLVVPLLLLLLVLLLLLLLLVVVLRYRIEEVGCRELGGINSHSDNKDLTLPVFKKVEMDPANSAILMFQSLTTSSMLSPTRSTCLMIDVFVCCNDAT